MTTSQATVNPDQTLSPLPPSLKGSGEGEEGLNVGDVAGGPDRTDGAASLCGAQTPS